MKFSMPKINLPKVKKADLDISKLNVRKFNWVTVLGVLAYINILAVPIYIASKSHPFLRFHAKQGLVLFVYFAIVTFSLYLPLFPWIFYAFYLFGIVWGVVNIILGRERAIPIIGKLAERV